MFHQDDRGLGQERVVEDLLFVLVVPHPDPGDYQCPARSFDYVPLETVVMKRGVEEEGQVPRSGVMVVRKLPDVRKTT